MTAGSMIDRQEDTQTRSNDRIKHSIPTPPHASPNFNKHTIAISTRQSSTGSTSNSGLQGRTTSKQLASTPSRLSESSAATTKAIAKAVDADNKSHAEIKDSDELCKDCRAQRRMTESVCFITNDGKISAVRTGHASYADHNHHCKRRGCAGSPSYLQSPSPSTLRRDSFSEKQAPLNPQPPRRKSLTLPRTGDLRESTASSIEGHDCTEKKIESSLTGSSETSSSIGSDIKKELENCVDTNSLCHTAIDQNGLDVVSPSQERHSSWTTTQVTKDQQSYVDNTHVENLEVHSSAAASCISSEYIYDDDDKGSVCGDDIQALQEYKGPLSHHKANAYSCGEGGTDAPTTPNSLIKGVFNDLSTIDSKQSHCKREPSRPTRSAMARMRQKYLESLNEQEAEKVRLRKQEIMARKQAADWMLDCYMEEVLHRLAPSGEAHVKVLVEAFETVMNQSDSESLQTAHHEGQEHLEDLVHH